MNSSVKALRHEADSLPSINDRGLHCPVDLTVAIIGGKWKSPILWYLSEAERALRFAELRRLMPTITHRVLTRQLRELENDGIIFRDVYPVVPPKVEYGLTDRGRTLLPVLSEMCEWGLKNGWETKPGKTKAEVEPEART